MKFQHPNRNSLIRERLCPVRIEKNTFRRNNYKMYPNPFFKINGGLLTKCFAKNDYK
jgi:hypothetical protein